MTPPRSSAARRSSTDDLDGGGLAGAIERLLGDADARRRRMEIAARIQASPGTALAADLIERLALR